MTHASKPIWQSRALVMVIALTAVVPFALAWYYANHPELIDRTSNYGSLILPTRQLSHDQLMAAPLGPVNEMAQIKGRWLLLQVAPGLCATVCVETLHKTHQGWLMLNKEMPRVQRILLVSPETRSREVPEIAKDDALVTSGLTPEVLQALTSAIGKPAEEGVVVLVDPLGNLVLWYDTGFDPYKMVRDLKHLLKASQIG
ncbi:MAG: hypothetical protein RLZZ09_1941 [Pseudomonadota bacterium]|jgi:hypothetical protein